MARIVNTKRRTSENSKARRTDVFRLRDGKDSPPAANSRVHDLGKGRICDTEPRGHATPRGRSLVEIVVDASEGFIPLWARNTTLRWRFRETSLHNFTNPAGAKTEIRKLFAEALVKWGTAAPVKFTEDEDVWDFEIVMRAADNCSPSGCVLASSFFPDAGRHKFVLYPKMFTQDRTEQVETFIHELGHVFGLRHFFANVSETAWPSEIFGTHSKFSIMNYGSLSELTPEDKSDLRRLYQAVWNGTLTHINATPIRIVQPFHTLAPAPDHAVAAGAVEAVCQPQPMVAFTRRI